MSATTAERGYFVLADISGFEAYLAGVELEHAQGVLQELLELLVARLTPPLLLASIEGDAVLAYAPADRLPRGETLLELTEAAYVAFRDRLASIHRNNTCDCRACRSVPSLDLKFMVHFGEFTAQAGPAGSVELGGLDASLVRQRLLKDQISEADSMPAYALFTERSLQQMGLQPKGMRPKSRSYPHLGEVKTACVDLRSRYDQLTEARRAYVAAAEADIALTHDYPAPPPILWEWLNDPARRTRWTRWRSWTAGLRPDGRLGIGAQNHCTHGMGTVVETVLDWRPYRYFTVEDRQASLGFSATSTYELEPLPNQGGTRLHHRIRFPQTQPLWLAPPFAKWGLARMWDSDLKSLARHLARAEAAAGE